MGSEDFEITDQDSLLQMVDAWNQAEQMKRLSAIKGFSGRLERAIESAKRKFEQFDGHKRLLLLSYVGDSFSGVLDEDLSELVAAAKLPRKSTKYGWRTTPGLASGSTISRGSGCDRLLTTKVTHQKDENNAAPSD